MDKSVFPDLETYDTANDHMPSEMTRDDLRGSLLLGLSVLQGREQGGFTGQPEPSVRDGLAAEYGLDDAQTALLLDMYRQIAVENQPAHAVVLMLPAGGDLTDNQIDAGICQTAEALLARGHVKLAADMVHVTAQDVRLNRAACEYYGLEPFAPREVPVAVN